MEINSEEAIRFLSFIFQNCEDGSGHINLRDKDPFGNVHSNFLSLDHVEDIPSILSEKKDSDWWFGPALRNGYKGKKENISLIPALHLEHDSLNAEIEKEIEGFLKPSAIVQTSLPTKKQIYFLLKEPVGPEEIPRVEDINSRLIARFGGDRGTQDASRVLRIPGTFNYKKEYQTPLQCRILELNPQCQYSLDDFDILPKTQNPNSEPHINHSERLEKIMQCSFLQHCDRDRTTLPEPQWYAMVSLLARETGGPDLIHSLSQGYPKYSANETDQKILHALNDSGPLTCLKIKSLYDCGRDCRITSPIILGFHKNSLDSKSQETDKGKKSSIELKLTTITEVLEYPEVSFLIQDLFPEEIIAVIGGYTGTGKSMVILEIVKSIVTGNPLFGKYAVNKKGPALIVDEETPRPLLRDRIQKMKFDPSWPVYFLHFQDIKIDKESVFNALLEKIKEVKPVLVVFDSLIRIHRKREKESEEMAQVIDALRKIANLGILVIPIHHHKKGGGPLTEKLRGSSDIPGGIDIEFALTPEKEGGDILLFQSVKTRIKPVPPIRLKLNITEDTATVDYCGTKSETVLDIIVSLLSEEVEFLTVKAITQKLIEKNFDEFKEYEIRKALKEGVRFGTLEDRDMRVGKTKATTYRVK